MSITIKNIRVWRSWIIVSIVVLPILAAYIRQTLYYKGCMDGMGWVLFAIFAGFGFGGIVNALNLCYVLIREMIIMKIVAEMTDGAKNVYMSGLIIGSIVFLAQVLILCWYFLILRTG